MVARTYDGETACHLPRDRRHAPSRDVHQIITDKIIAEVESGNTGQWTCPWHRTGGGLPINGVTGKPYRGINILALWVAADERRLLRPALGHVSPVGQPWSADPPRREGIHDRLLQGSRPRSR
jgi:hypothetical protein